MTKLKESLMLSLLALVLSGSAAMAAPGNGRAEWYSKEIPERNIPANNSYSQLITQGGAPMLQGATMGTIGPQGVDATQVMGLMTAGTVRVNNYANLEALLNIMANGALLGGHILGIWYLIRTLRLTLKTPGKVLGGLAKGLSFISIGLLTPSFVSWAFAMARDAALF